MINEERSTRDNGGCSSLPPSLTKRNNGPRNHNNAAMMKKRSSDKQQPILTTCLSSSSSYSSLSTFNFKAIKNSSKDNNGNKKRVVFNELVKVVLIPSRQEYKLRGLELMLWWNPTDYFQFQQEARSEITLCATFENISFTQARTKLYQPDPMEIDQYNSKLTKSQSITEMSLQAIDDDDYYSASVETSPMNTQYSRHGNNSNSNRSNDCSDSSSNDTSDDSDEDKDSSNMNGNIMSGRIRFYQHSPKPSQSSLILVNSSNNKGNTYPPSSSSASALRILSKLMSANALDTYHEDNNDDDDCNNEANNNGNMSVSGCDRNLNGEITVTATAIAKYSLTKSASAPALLSTIHTTTTTTTATAIAKYSLAKSASAPALLSTIHTTTTTTNNNNNNIVNNEYHNLVQQQQQESPPQQQPIDDLHICVLSSQYQSLTSSSTYPDTYLDRLRKRNLESFTGIDFSINCTPSLTVCSVFALTVVAVVSRFF